MIVYNDARECMFDDIYISYAQLSDHGQATFVELATSNIQCLYDNENVR